MAEGHGRQRWAHTSLLCALIANSNRDPKKTRAYKADDFNPYCRSQRREVIEVTKDTLPLLREAFTGRKG